MRGEKGGGWVWCGGCVVWWIQKRGGGELVMGMRFEVKAKREKAWIGGRDRRGRGIAARSCAGYKRGDTRRERVEMVGGVGQENGKTGSLGLFSANCCPLVVVEFQRPRRRLRTKSKADNVFRKQRFPTHAFFLIPTLCKSQPAQRTLPHSATL